MHYLEFTNSKLTQKSVACVPVLFWFFFNQVNELELCQEASQRFLLLTFEIYGYVQFKREEGWSWSVNSAAF